MRQRSEQPERPGLIGREAATEGLLGLMRDSRLVTVVGPGGVGKSALAAEAVERIARTGHTIGTVDLSELSDPDLARHALVHALGPQRDEGLGERRTLLVVDHCEHLAAACAAAIGRLLTEVPGLRVLATSRRRLGTAGETVLPLAPLALDDAVTLFELRAGQLGVRLGSAEEDRVTAGRICLRLDSLPLAVGLAAGQLTGCTPRELLVRLSRAGACLDLTGGGQGVPERHRTLRRCHGLSHELCAPQERLLWARLSAFEGTFTRSAAETVCHDRQLPRSAVGRTVEGLVGQGLLSHVMGRPELIRMPRTVREYGAEWLARLGEEARLLERVLLWSRGAL
ncbi:ATP-binding protein [Streptomyces sp. NPDC054796]